MYCLIYAEIGLGRGASGKSERTEHLNLEMKCAKRRKDNRGLALENIDKEKKANKTQYLNRKMPRKTLTRGVLLNINDY